jgi:hypothetical protein
MVQTERLYNEQTSWYKFFFVVTYNPNILYVVWNILLEYEPRYESDVRNNNRVFHSYYFNGAGSYLEAENRGTPLESLRLSWNLRINCHIHRDTSQTFLRLCNAFQNSIRHSFRYISTLLLHLSLSFTNCVFQAGFSITPFVGIFNITYECCITCPSQVLDFYHLKWITR